MRLERWRYALPVRLRAMLRPRAVEREREEELRYHLERQAEAHVAAGMDPADAWEAARRALAPAPALAVTEHAPTPAPGGVPGRRGAPLGAGALRDVRHALRALRRAPGFATVAVLTLALGIGATVAIFTVVNAVLLRPLPYADPERLVVLRYASMQTVAAANFLDWRAEARTVERAGAAEWWTPALAGRERAEELPAIRLTPDVLPLLGVPPLLGRAFLPEEGRPGRERVVVLGHEVWRTRFGGDSGVVGRAVRLNGEPYTVVGVMPPGFRFAPFWASEAALAAPLVLDHRASDRTGASLRVFARLRRDATLDDARTELAAIGARLERAFPGTNPRTTVVPMKEMVVGDVRPALVVLLAAVGFVLLLTCANVAHLQLMRGAARERESAVRTALGAPRGRLVRQSLAESGVVAAAGGALGLALAYAGVRLLVRLAPPGLPRLDTVAVDAGALAFALAATLFAGLAFGLGPALASSRVPLAPSLREGGRGAGDGVRRRRVRGALVVSEFAMALVLLVGAGLVLRSFAALTAVDPGFDARGVLTMQVSVRGTAWAEPARRAAFFRELLDRVRALPGVEAASAINHLPLHGDAWNLPFAVEGRPLAPPGESANGFFRIARPGYFHTMRIPILAGRDFTPADEAAGAKVVVVNEHMARTHWPGRSPIGQRISVDDPATAPDWFTVVGVVKDARRGRWSEAPDEEMYFPHRPTSLPEGAMRLEAMLNPAYMTVVLRTTTEPGALALAVARVARALDPDAPVSDVITMPQVVAEELAGPRFYLLLLGAFAAVALVIAAVGVYGVISYSTARRTREIGVRLALGAGRADPVRLVVGQGMRLAALGTGVGLLAALGVVRYLRTLLYGVQPTDPATFAGVTLLLGAVALAACAIPAWRAARTDPVVALRSE